MYIRLSRLLLLGCTIVGVLAENNTKNETSEAKTKRGIYHLSDPNLGLVPLHHLARFSQVRTLADDASQVDITYKPQEDTKPQVYPQNSYDFGDALKVSSNNNYKFNEPTQLPQHHLSSYAPSPYPNPLAQQSTKPQDHFALPSQHLLAPQYPQYHLNQKLSTPLSFYGGDKHVALPANIRTTSEIKLPEYVESYSTIPIIYGQPGASLPSLKYIQPLAKTQYNLPAAYNPLSLTSSYQTAPYKLPPKLQINPLQQHRLPQHQQLFQNYNKPIQHNFFQPQVFDNPVVPQIQHYIPPIQSPFDAFTKPIPAPIQKPAPPPPKKEQKPQNSDEEDDEDEDEDDDGKHEHKEQVRGEIVRHEVNDEEEFDKGYDDASRGFQAYDDDDDYRRSRHHHNQDDEDRYERFKARYEAERDDDHRGHYSTKREHSRKPHDYDGDRDHEGHYSSKKSKKEPRDKHHKSKSSYEAGSKYYKNEDNDRSQSKKPKNYSKYYSKSSSSKKPQSDSRYVSSSTKKQNVKKPISSSARESASARSEVEFKPSYQYGFEPLKIQQHDDAKLYEGLDLVAKHSEPNQSRKLYKENWYFSKTTKSQ